MKNKNDTDRNIPKSNGTIEDTESKSIPITHIYMAASSEIILIRF